MLVGWVSAIYAYIYRKVGSKAWCHVKCDDCKGSNTICNKITAIKYDFTPYLTRLSTTCVEELMVFRHLSAGNRQKEVLTSMPRFDSHAVFLQVDLALGQLNTARKPKELANLEQALTSGVFGVIL